jgi:hypothetical protein
MTLHFTAPESPSLGTVLARLFHEIEAAVARPDKRRGRSEVHGLSDHLRRDVGLEPIERSGAWDMLR